MIAFAFGATVINYLDRQTLSVTAPILTKEFHMNDETYGLVLLAFMLAYTIMNGLSGPVIDRVGTKIGYAAAWRGGPRQEFCTSLRAVHFRSARFGFCSAWAKRATGLPR